MIKPWNYKPDDIRHADSLPTFIIFCEDEISEAQYLKYFETSLIKINTVEGQKSKFTHVVKAICHCLDQEIIIRGIDGNLQLKDDNAHLWCVFDRDIEEDQATKNRTDIEFDEAIHTGTNRGFSVAWSNDAFELWILLHFEEVNPLLPENKIRETYYKKLTEIFKKLPNKNEDLNKALSHPSFSYKKDLKHKNNFLNIVRSEIVVNTKTAILRAERLEAHHTKLNLSNHDKAPCTMVHYLVKELIKYGGKKIS
jgi:hypothetical protein